MLTDTWLKEARHRRAVANVRLWEAGPGEFFPALCEYRDARADFEWELGFQHNLYMQREGGVS